MTIEENNDEKEKEEVADGGRDHGEDPEDGEDGGGRLLAGVVEEDSPLARVEAGWAAVAEGGGSGRMRKSKTPEVAANLRHVDGGCEIGGMSEAERERQMFVEFVRLFQRATSLTSISQI
ncbi:hypothetical protein NL676_020193 [Syzygium grande]|nr:hypothetical protein NL676_020193 [Syzygium grande]